MGGTIRTSDSCTVLETGLTFSSDCSWEQWSRKGSELRTATRVFYKHLRWWIGDWINFGEERFPRKYTQALDADLYSIGALRNVSWVCRHVPRENRRLTLSFDHHTNVAKLKPSEQKKFLDLAEQNSWTVRQLRMAVAGKRVSTNALPSKVDWKPPAEPQVFSFGDWWEKYGQWIAKSANDPKRIAEEAWNAARK